jgi:hypothetical protein
MTSRLPLSDLLTWEPEDIATALQWLEDRADAIKDQQR